MEAIKNFTPDILAYIFDILVKALKMYDELKNQIEPNHRLADFVIWGEVISRAIGNDADEFLKAWLQNIQQQNISVIQNSSFVGLLVDLLFNHYRENIEFMIEPATLFKDLKEYANNKKIDYNHDHTLPQNPASMSRKIREHTENLKAAGVQVDPDIRKEQKRWIFVSKKSIKKESMDEYAS